MEQLVMESPPAQSESSRLQEEWKEIATTIAAASLAFDRSHARRYEGINGRLALSDRQHEEMDKEVQDAGNALASLKGRRGSIEEKLLKFGETALIESDRDRCNERLQEVNRL